MAKKLWLILLGIVTLGFVIRVYKIQSLPMYGDELTMVYDEYSILKTGMDATGQKFPLTFKMGAGRPGGYIYFSVPFVAVFGPTLWGERTLSLLSGLGIIVLMYFLGKKLFNEKVGIIASLLTAVCPWDIYLSRAGFEAHFALFLALLGVVFFLDKKYIGWAIAWGLTIFTYPTFKLTLPLMLIFLVFWKGIKDIVKDKIFWIGIVVLAVFGLIIGYQTFFAGSEQRFFSLNIFSDETIKNNIIQTVDNDRNFATLPIVFKDIFINREIEYGRLLLDNYVANLSPDFLFLRGDGQPRDNPGEMGMLYLIDFPLLIAGLVLLWKDERKKFTLLLAWILITPLATMFFMNPHALRNDLMIPPLLVIISYAFTKISRKFTYVAIALIAIQLIYILVHIYNIAPAKFVSFWSADAESVALKAIQAQKSGQKVTLNVTKVDNIEYAYEVYAKLDPREVIAQSGKFPKVYGNVTITDK
ncbi:MAG: glycosyltransferase family 39 protein [Candidatus Microgenomates bacterium]|jgi:4-amino-4-deoxy-L-arabinose transferase-like glycosyltransferase